MIDISYIYRIVLSWSRLFSLSPIAVVVCLLATPATNNHDNTPRIDMVWWIHRIFISLVYYLGDWIYTATS